MSLILENLDILNNEIQETCKKVGRTPEEIKLVAVTKTIDFPRVNEALGLGVKAIGENKVQEFLQKEILLPKDIERHFVGHLQKNKVKYLIGKVDLVHSIDSITMIEEMEKHEVMFNGLLQINVSGELTKYGIPSDEIKPFLSKMKFYKNVKIKGLMTMAPFTTDHVAIRTVFKKLRELFKNLQDYNDENISMEYLSMGMSNDFKIAIEEGATIIRIGSIIFGKREGV